MEVISFNNVTKFYKIHINKPIALKEKIINTILRRNQPEIKKHMVLNDVSFIINKGETIGIIGENGTGKSTILKLIANILRANEGEVSVNGRVSSLIEIGAGFHPELTGRENIYLYGSILGLKKKFIDNHFDEIVTFADMQDFIDSPVKNYSSGMYMRLAFSVATSVEPDILLIDEILAVGDETFQRKCFGRINNFKEQGKTIIFVSHDLKAVKTICTRVLYINQQKKVIQGAPENMINLYQTRTIAN